MCSFHLYRQQTMSLGKMEIQLSSMRRGSYQAMITAANMVSMTHISTCIRVQVSSDGLTMCIHSLC